MSGAKKTENTKPIVKHGGGSITLRHIVAASLLLELGLNQDRMNYGYIQISIYFGLSYSTITT